MRQQEISTGELSRKLSSYDFSFSIRQLQRLARQNKLPRFLRYVERPSGRPSERKYRREFGGNYRWNWPKIERAVIEFDIEILADFIQREQDGDIGKIKRHLFWLLGIYSHFFPRNVAMKTLYTLCSPMWKEPQVQKQMMQLWEHEVKPKLITEFEERLKYGKFGLP